MARTPKSTRAKEVDGDTGKSAEDAAKLEGEPRLYRAEEIVKDHVLMSSAAGLIPSPSIDLLAAFGVQLTMMSRLCSLYGVPFSKNIGKGIILTLFGSVGSLAFASGLFFSAVKFVPGAGTLAGVVSLPLTLGAFTYGLGKVMIGHFEMGGGLLDFDPRVNNRYFKEMYGRGRAFATSWMKKVDPGTAQNEAPATEG